MSETVGSLLKHADSGKSRGMERVLVTGGAGFIGSHLVDRLVLAGHSVVVLDDLSSGNLMNLQNHGERITFIKDRIENIEQHRDALSGVDTVFHLAALISGYDSLSEPEAYWETNNNGLLRMLALFKGRKVRIVFASSSTVYGNLGTDTPLCESSPPRPLTAYALTKLAGEHTLRMYAPLYDYSYVSLRLFNVYGPRQNPDHPYANVTCKFARAAAQSLPIKLYGDGQQTRDFVFVDDVVEAFLSVAQSSNEEVYNIGTGADTSIASLIELVGSIAGRCLDIERCPSWPNDIRCIRANTERYQREFGPKAMTGLEQGLSQTVAFFSS